MKQGMLGAAFVLTVLFLIGGMAGIGAYQSYQKDQLVVGMIKDGVDPVAARCAVKADADDAICYARGKVLQVPGIVKVPVPFLPPQKGFWQSDY